MVECNHDCLNCPYPDAPEECLEGPLSLDDYRELDWLDREIIRPKTERQKKASAKQKAYYEANREEIAAKRRAYREANREEIAAKQKAIADVRRARRMTQRDLATLCGVTQPAISQWESGCLPAPWDKLCAVLPELEQYRPNKNAADGTAIHDQRQSKNKALSL
nr:MAG TPA: helix-turn-helix domain protein [Caudoviricetes sp.]